MTQAIWKSPQLPLIDGVYPETGKAELGSGLRFKRDLVKYLNHYGKNRTGPLVSEIEKYDFSTVKAALISSVPTRVSLHTGGETTTSFGWPGLRQILLRVPVTSFSEEGRPLIVSQISSIAQLGQGWLGHFLNILNGSPMTSEGYVVHQTPRHRVMFPTANEIRHCLDGYAAGASIHMKLQSKQAQRQVSTLRQFLVRWGGNEDDQVIQDSAGRERAAPHIKTYMRFNDKLDRIDWAMLTSANLSTQAWGSLPLDSQVRICSYEIGVVVWPSLLGDAANAVMVPTFKTNTPKGSIQHDGQTMIGFRMPYNMPLTPYDEADSPWCASASYDEPDWMGHMWR